MRQRDRGREREREREEEREFESEIVKTSTYQHTRAPENTTCITLEDDTIFFFFFFLQKTIIIMLRLFSSFTFHMFKLISIRDKGVTSSEEWKKEETKE